MISFRLLTTVGVAAAILLLLELLRWLIEKAIVRRFMPDSDIDTQFWAPFILNLIFMVILPTIVYAALYPVLPFSGHHAGFFIGLFVFGVGILPNQIRSYNQFKLASGLVAFQLLWVLLTLLLVIGSITYTYHY